MIYNFIILISAGLIALTISLFMTQIISVTLKKKNILDYPDVRKIHQNPVPRGGGIAIYFAVLITVLIIFLPINTKYFFATNQVLFLLMGASLIFMLGLIDDLKRISYKYKIIIQLFICCLSYISGIRIESFNIPGIINITSKPFLFFMTIIWIMLVINSINLIDGMDGLAAGVSAIAAFFMGIYCLLTGKIIEGVVFFALLGGCIGFLRYNFPPAKIFMGDSGSYFIGYIFGGLSIIANIKSYSAAAFIIPIITLGLPLMDVLWAIIRRLLYGQNIFKPDKSHLHHQLIKMGLNHNEIIKIMYLIAIGLGFISISIIYMRENLLGLILLGLIIGSIVVGSVFGYIDFIRVENSINWAREILDIFGLRRERRLFLGKQVDLIKAADLDSVWEKIVEIANMLGFEKIEINLRYNNGSYQDNIYKSRGMNENNKDCLNKENCSFHICIPLYYYDQLVGTLILGQNSDKKINMFMLCRIEHLRRTLEYKIKELIEQKSNNYKKEFRLF